MFSKHKREKPSYGIVGLGRFGYALARKLAELDADIMVLEKDEETVREIREYIEDAIEIKTLDRNSLLETGIQNCDVAIVCIGDQLDSSILTTLHLVGMGIPKVIARASSEEHGQILKKLGADVVYPESDMAVRLANRLEASNILDLTKLNKDVSISKFTVPYEMEDETVMGFDMDKKFGVRIIAIEREGNIDENFSSSHVFEEGDIIYVIGRREKLRKLEEWIEDN